MSVLTRIKNNQITDATIWANAKIIAGSIVGSLFNSNITVTSDFTITGNLTVQGAATYLTVASTNTYVNDPLIVLNNAFSGANQYDLGFIFNRGSSTNQAFYWDESSDEFKLIATSETGTTYGNIAAETSFSNLRLGNLTAQYNLSTTSLTATGLINTSGNLIAATSIAQLHTGTTATFGNVAAGFIGNTGTAFSGASINVTGNVIASTVLADLLTANDVTVGNVAAGFIGNTGTVYTGASINLSGNILSTGAVHNALTVNGATGISGNIIAGLAQFAAINSTPIGNASAASGAFTTLSASQNFYANASIATTTQGTGAVVVPNGGISVAGAANIAGAITTAGATQLNSTLGVGGITTLTNTTNTTPGSNSGALQVQGGVSINKDLWIGGNLYVSNIFTTSYTTLSVQDPLLYLTAANTFPYTYDIGIYSQFVGGVGNIYQHTGVVRDNADAYWKFFSNVVAEPDGGVTFDSTTKYDGIRAGNLNLTDSTASTTTGTGALIVVGGAGIGGAINAASLNVSGNVLASTVGASYITASTMAVGNIAAVNFGNASAIFTGASINLSGNVLASTIRASFLTASTTAVGNISAVTIGNAGATVTGTTAAFSGNVIGGLAQFAAINSTPIGNATVSTGAFSDLRATGTVYANATTDTTSLSTGALIVAGGTAVGKTLWVGEGARINSTQSAESFHVLGQGTSSSLIYADFAKNAMVFGGANVLVQDGVVTKFNSDGAILLPVGSSARRPGAAGNVDVAGLLRYSTTSNNVEFYDGTNWLSAGSTFTVIATNAFSGNGVQTAFTLGSSSTTAGTIVMVNGIVQIPTTAYSVTGTALTFTEAPATGDAIDARVITTTSIVSSIASANGYNTFDVATLPYANITAGTSSPTVRVSVDGATGRVTFTNDVTINGSLTVLGDSNGNINIGNETGDRLQLRGKTVYDQTAINVPNTNLREIDSFSVSAFTTARYTVQVVNGGGVSAAELLVSHDDATSNIATYAVISTIPGTFQSNISSGTVRVFYTPSGAQNANIKVLTTYIV
jgi:hypothetical protein